MLKKKDQQIKNLREQVDAKQNELVAERKNFDELGQKYMALEKVSASDKEKGQENGRLIENLQSALNYQKE